MMRNSLTLVGRNLRGRDVDAAIDLDRVEVDDLTIDDTGQADAKLAFARSRRAYDCRYHSRFHVTRHTAMLAIAIRRLQACAYHLRLSAVARVDCLFFAAAARSSSSLAPR